MKVEVSEESITSLEEYALIPIAFEVNKFFQVEESNNHFAEFLLTERNLDVPYIKDYDAIDGEHPLQWSKHFDMSNWRMFVARAEGRRAGGAIVAVDTPGLLMLEGRRDLAVLWDIRVSAEIRGQGVGSALLRAAEEWAKAIGCRQFKVETQNINVAACRFYAKQGFQLAAIHRFAYPTLPHEIQFLWHKNIFPDVSFSQTRHSE